MNAWRNTLSRSFMHRRLWVNDPDCLMLRAERTKLEPEQMRAWALAVGVSGGMALVSDDLSLLGADARSLLDEVLALGREADADELTQATFLACVTSKDRFRGDSSFRTYLFTIARNELYRVLRNRQRKGAQVDFGLSSIAELVSTPGTRLARNQEHRQLVEALRLDGFLFEEDVDQPGVETD